MYYFYLVRCADHSLYCGQTKDLDRRIREHNSDSSRSAKYTRVRRPVLLEYSEPYATLALAMKREWEVKQWTKAKKEVLIRGK